MNELIRVQHNDDGNIIVSGRELYEFLELKAPYTQWFDRMVVEDEYFEENVDYALLHKNVKQRGRGGHNKVDHALTIDMAKELAMLQRNEKGKQARTYFIEVEKKFKQGIQQDIESPNTKELSVAERIEMMKLVANCPTSNLESVMAIAKPFIDEASVKTLTPEPVAVIEVPTPAKKNDYKAIASSAGYLTPFKRQTLKNYMRRNNLTHGELAKLADVNGSTLSTVLIGRQSPGMETRHKICQALEKPNSWLNGGT